MFRFSLWSTQTQRPLCRGDARPLHCGDDRSKMVIVVMIVEKSVICWCRDNYRADAKSFHHWYRRALVMEDLSGDVSTITPLDADNPGPLMCFSSFATNWREVEVEWAEAISIKNSGEIKRPCSQITGKIQQEKPCQWSQCPLAHYWPQPCIQVSVTLWFDPPAWDLPLVQREITNLWVWE